MSTHNICFRREIRKILCEYPLLSVAMTVTVFTLNIGLYTLTILILMFEQVHFTSC